MTQPATAERFRSDPAATSAPAPSSRALIVDPLGDGRTRRFTDPAESWIDFGDRLIPPCATAARRPSASAASCPGRTQPPSRPFHRYGHGHPRVDGDGHGSREAQHVDDDSDDGTALSGIRHQ